MATPEASSDRNETTTRSLRGIVVTQTFVDACVEYCADGIDLPGAFEEPLDDAALLELLFEHDIIETETCKFCVKRCVAATAHRHQGQWVGDECCWEERLRKTE